jgi:hypothetical protein
MQATTEYLVFYKQILDFHRPFKILCQKSGRENHWSLLYMAETEIDCIEDGDKTIKKHKLIATVRDRYRTQRTTVPLIFLYTLPLTFWAINTHRV